ncbi:hydrolase [Enterococcus florum]|uniref:Hydrolase n=1 Tax=Enterococcus florum TaxID=2480627 RepID=A0A4V0WPC5_9ENTE|nr:fumarylacetoacetate hydrolase family protein [Enterococcus florum]GCF93379.1 hydrolase [Enterococcus florum]
MKFCTFKQGKIKVGLVSEDEQYVYPLDERFPEITKMEDLITAYPTIKDRINKAKDEVTPLPLAEIKLLAPIPQPKHDLLCVGLNYKLHAIESANFAGREYQPPVHPVYFSKRVNQAVGPDGAVFAHEDITNKLDYEVELAVVIGKTCSHVAPEEVFDYIFGYTIGNDISARDLQFAYGQYTFGKGLDHFAPIGPWIVTEDAFSRPPHINLKAYVNDELRQNSNTEDLIFDLPHLISELSQGITLEPGDIVLTGTPSGVGMGFNPPKFLKKGDVVVCQIEGIGTLKNIVT